MQGMRMKSHKQSFSNQRQNSFSQHPYWEPRHYSSHQTEPQAPVSQKLIRMQKEAKAKARRGDAKKSKRN